MRTSHELEGHGNSVLIVGHFCGVVISCRGELRGDGLKESWSRREVCVVFSQVRPIPWRGFLKSSACAAAPSLIGCPSSSLQSPA
jgi:hypothetical protein